MKIFALNLSIPSEKEVTTEWPENEKKVVGIVEKILFGNASGIILAISTRKANQLIGTLLMIEKKAGMGEFVYV